MGYPSTAPEVVADGQWSTLVEMCRSRALEDSPRSYFSYLENGLEESDSLTLGELDRRARAIAVHLRASCSPGGRVLLHYPPGLEFVSAFFGCLYASLIAVPVAPLEVKRNDAKVARLQSIHASAGSEILMSTSAMLARLEEALPLDGLPRLATDEVDVAKAADWTPPDITAETVAYLQYSSGSTGAPKGVVLSHANVLHNLALIHENGSRGDEAEDEIPPPVVLWLPLFHDMGLINGILQPLFAGYEVTLMPPMAFVQRPFSWLRAISDRGSAISVAPNFAFELCLRRVSDEQISRIDLSGWRLAAVGSEPVRADTLECFVERFGPCGFRREALFPCYGLAESTVMVSGGPAVAEPVIRHFDAADLAAAKVRLADPGARAKQLVGCGQIQPSLTLVVVDPRSGKPCGQDEVGEIYVSGPSVGGGYWNAPDETERAFHAEIPGWPDLRFLRTGDLGFVHEGQLFITGRAKDVVILDGLNYYPHDLEATASLSHPAIREGFTCAFSTDDGQRERLVVLVEIDRRYSVVDELGADQVPNAVLAQDVERAVRRTISAEHKVQVTEVLLLRAGTLPFTSSNKIQRLNCRELHSTGRFESARYA